MQGLKAALPVHLGPTPAKVTVLFCACWLVASSEIQRSPNCIRKRWRNSSRHLLVLGSFLSISVYLPLPLFLAYIPLGPLPLPLLPPRAQSPPPSSIKVASLLFCCLPSSSELPPASLPSVLVAYGAPSCTVSKPCFFLLPLLPSVSCALQPRFPFIPLT